MRIIFTSILLLLITSCSTFKFPGVHRITIQQGNVISQAMVDKLRPGMTRSQVRFVLGNPVVNDALNQDQWDYVYSIQLSGGTPLKRNLTLHFREDRLSYFEGDYIPTENAKMISEES